jgi:hypothetical protein
LLFEIAMPEKVFDEQLDLLAPAFWSSRQAARKCLRESANDAEAVNKTLRFLALRGTIKKALHVGNYSLANKELRNYRSNSGVSKTLLKKQIGVLGICIKNGHEHFTSLKKHLKENEESRVNKKSVKQHELLKFMLVSAHTQY